MKQLTVQIFGGVGGVVLLDLPQVLEVDVVGVVSVHIVFGSSRGMNEMRSQRSEELKQ